MVYKRSYVAGIMDDKKIDEFNTIISINGEITQQSSAHMFFGKQPIDSNNIIQDVTFFHLDAENESKLKNKLDDLIEKLNDLDCDYVLMDSESGKMIVLFEFGAAITVKFDRVKFLKEGTYKKLDELKDIKTEFGYCKGFKANFRPIEGQSIENKEVNDEDIYLISNSEQNLLKLREFLSEKILEINPDLEFEYRVIS